ncbi:glycosyltransferase [Thermostichus vulcanus]|uniref:Glycosyltransferase n=1 Tax=Thermostichus vulcanus str. 'Rupite' TaxID=2813851 RepID=A0ABT0CDZ7_THEVL|nr:glycosyltransferase [Thermostichus vulcanus]MCJ2544011.1 glycosyltransferase [Thermostichus vulcanus str. 'Rupite']
MNILHVIPSIANIRGGPSLVAIETVRALNELGINSCIVTTNDNGEQLLDVPLNRWTEYEGVSIQFFSRFSPAITPIREFAFSSQLTYWLWHNISTFDLVHIHAIFSFPSTVAMVIARLRKVPYIVSPLGQLTTWALQQRSVKKQIYLNLLEKSNLNKSNSIHYTSEQEQQEASSLNLSAPSFIQPHGLALPEIIVDARAELRTYLNLPANETIILFLSRLHLKKGLDLTIPALAKLKHNNFTFLLAGQGTAEYEAEIEALLETHQLVSRTIRPGFVVGRLKDLFLQGSDLFVLNSYSENFGMAVLEAMASGLPVLTSPNVGFASMVQTQDLCLIVPQEVATIAERIAYALDHPVEMQEMAQRAKTYVAENFTWNRVAKNLIEIYQQIIDQSNECSP